MDHVVAVFDDDERLAMVCHILLIDLGHVLSYAGLLTIVLELMVSWVCLTIDSVDDVSTLVAPVGNYR